MSGIELKAENAIHAVDDGFDLPEPQVDPVDSIGKGPSRCSVFVPTEHTVLNLGAPVLEHGGAGKHPQIDRGVVAQTDHHIHLHTFGDPQEVQFKQLDDDSTTASAHVAYTRTILRLGTPVSVVKAGHDYGSEAHNTLDVPTKIGSGYSLPYTLWDGYAMLTEGGSYHESWGNNLIVSGNADVRVAGMRSVLIGSPGDIHISVDEDTIEQLVANNFDSDLVAQESSELDAEDKQKKVEEIAKKKSLSASGRWSTQKKGWSAFGLAMKTLSTGLGVYTAIDATCHLKYGRPPEEGMTGWKALFKGSFFDDVGDAIGLVTPFISPVVGLFTTAFAFDDFLDPSTGTDRSVSIYAAKNVNIYGQKNVSSQSELSTSISSSAFASFSSNVSTSVSSLISTSVSGAVTSMGGLFGVSISSQYGPASLRGKSSATLASWGKVFVSGNENVQVNSMEGQVLLHGSKGFYLGATGLGGVGYGLRSDGKTLTMGQMSRTSMFLEAAADDKQPNMLRFQDDKIELRYKTSDISLDESGITIGKTAKRISIA